MNSTTLLAALGLTKKSLARAGLASLFRRVVIHDFEQAELYESPSSEIKRFLADKNMRVMYIRIGKGLESNLFDKGKMYDNFMGLLDEHSGTLSLIGERLEDGEELKVDDEVVDTFIGDMIGVIKSRFVDSDDSQKLPATGALGAGQPLTSNLVERIKNMSDSLTVEDVFPDLYEHLTPRANGRILLNM